MAPLDVGLLILRVVLGLLLVGHASQKLLGLFRGKGIAGTAGLFEASGLRPGVPLVIAAGLTELGGAGLLVLGLATPLAVSMVLGAMAVAISTLWSKGLWGHLGGYEVPFCYALMAFVLGVTGPGAFSLDALAPWSGAHGLPWALGALAVALLLSSPLIVMVMRHSRAHGEA
ncbi:DoxX family membrane protein [Microbacterium sp. NPDC089189]|uniref:DoxX family protein n=1 Tax=Microbacterium sp. NPDC089189 TaxID=3154972 RepID=UPI003444CD03